MENNKENNIGNNKENNKENFLSRFSSQNELLKRAASSFFIVTAIMGGITLGGWAWILVSSVIALVSLFEFYGLMKKKFHMSVALGLGIGAIMLFCAANFSFQAMLSLLCLVVFLVLFVEILRRQATGASNAIFNIGATVAGICYIILPWSFLIIIRKQNLGYIFLYTLFLCTWACDVCAYFVGKKWGKNLFCSNVSPKKTWEGFAGGVVGSIFTASLLSVTFNFPPLPLILLGALCGTAGQIGDLSESILKREADIKDTGSIIPGHGGMLDRFDSILINAALAFLIFEVMIR